jgi:Ca-activated chloride channel family protein
MGQLVRARAASRRTQVMFGVALALVVGALIWKNLNARVASPPSPQARPAEASAGETLRLTATLGRGHVLADQRHDLQLLVDIDAVKVAAARPPLDLAIVLDQSSSMSGEKLARAREAARGLIDSLQPDDRVALIRYETFVHVDVPLTEISAGRAALRGALDRMEALGATNISGGLEAARDTLTSGAEPGRVRRVLLLSDGHATAGLRDSRALGQLAADLRAGGVTVTSIGLGVDYNELAMAEVAQRGGGNYYFIARGDALASAFSRERDALTTTVARDVELVLQLAPGVRLQALEGFSYEQEGQVVRVPLGELAASQNKSLLFSLSLPELAVGDAAVSGVELRYYDMTRRQQARHAVSTSVVSTRDEALARAAASPLVARRREQLATAGAYDRAMELYEGGQREEALRLLDQRRQEIEALSDEIMAEEATKAREVFRAVKEHDAGSEEGRAAIKAQRSRSYQLKIAR